MGLGDIIGQDPRLLPLADNGGPTPTEALMMNSPAMGTADPAACVAPPVNGVDQRGFPRNAAFCDIGAWDGMMPAAPTNTATNTATSTATSTALNTALPGAMATVPPAATATRMPLTPLPPCILTVAVNSTVRQGGVGVIALTAAHDTRLEVTIVTTATYPAEAALMTGPTGGAVLGPVLLILTGLQVRHGERFAFKADKVSHARLAFPVPMTARVETVCVVAVTRQACGVGSLVTTSFRATAARGARPALLVGLVAATLRLTMPTRARLHPVMARARVLILTEPGATVTLRAILGTASGGWANGYRAGRTVYAYQGRANRAGLLALGVPLPAALLRLGHAGLVLLAATSGRRSATAAARLLVRAGP